jgi:DnaJ-domain-containing protein 1
MPLLSETRVKRVNIAANTEAPLSKDQKAFNNLIKKIEAQRKKLAEWETAVPLFYQKYSSDLLPLAEKETDLQISLAEALDRAHDQKGLTKPERRKLSNFIAELTEQVLAQREHEATKALYNKHSHCDFDADEAAERELAKAMLESVLGMDLGDDVDLSSPEEVMKKVEAQYRAQQEDWQEAQAKRKKSARELAQEARREVEEKQMSQSVREVYRKLASSLHPDRETDPEEQERKTALMQRANQAYEKGNLLQLLELQLELEHIDQAHLAGLKPERLKRYIKILKGQLAELEDEVLRIEDQFAAQFGLNPFEKRTASGIMTLLHVDIAQCEMSIRQLKNQIEAAADLKMLKGWLKTIAKRRMRDEDLDFLF